MASETRSLFISAISGNILEYYDFTVYSVFAAVIGRTFFPATSEYLQVLSSLAIFAVGFVLRPLGGIIFGYIGDYYGRRISLLISMLGMTVPTFIIAFIPSYAAIGIAAPIILALMRMIQGLCISGEGAGTAIFILEHRRNLRPGFTAGLVHGSNIAGTLLAAYVGILINKHFNYIDHAWRFAFILGGAMGFVGLYLRFRVAETPIFKMLAEQKKLLKAPFLHTIKSAKISMFITFCVGAAASSVLYLVKTYVNVFYHNIMHFDYVTSLKYSSYCCFVAMVTMPLFGLLSDYIGKLKTIVISASLIIFLAIPTMILMSSNITWHQITALSILGGLGGAISGSAYIFIISLFKPAERFSGVAFSYNFGIAIFGGTSPIISRWLVEQTNLFYAPAFYIIAISILFLLVIYCMRRDIKKLIAE